MLIKDYAISMSAQSEIIESYEREEMLRVWIDRNRPVLNVVAAIPEELPFQYGDSVIISDEGRFLSSLKSLSSSVSGAECVEESDVITLEPDKKDKQKLFLIQKMLEAITGKKIRFCIPEKINIRKLKGNSLPNSGIPAKVQDRSQERHGWGMEYNYSESYYEKQTLSFHSEGIIRTADGREIKFSLTLNMSREFASRFNLDIRAGDAIVKDPLVINFEGTAPSLTSKEFSFDIDCDGINDKIPFLSSGSGFLALDLNGDNIINDGSELFGPKTGNGFSELSQYDMDNNGWIDENDPVFESLRIWTKDENGNDVLFALGQKGIGAIYLGNINTLFSLKDNSNELKGTIQKTGIFIKENGMCGTVQHIDLTL